MQQAGDPLRSNEDIWCKILAPATSPPAVQAGAKTKMRSFDPIHNLGHSHRHHWQNEIGISQSVVLLAFHRSHLVISRGHVMTPTPPHPPTSHQAPHHIPPLKCTNTLLSHVVIIFLLLIISFQALATAPAEQRDIQHSRMLLTASQILTN